MMRLKSKLLSLNADKHHKTKVFSPANCEELKMSFKADKMAKVVGKLAAQIDPSHLDGDVDNKEPKLLTGVLVQNDFKLSLMAPEDLREYAGLATTTITCKQRLTLSAAGVELIKWALEGTFGTVKEISKKEEGRENMDGKVEVNGHGIKHEGEEADEEVDRSSVSYLVMDCVTVTYRRQGELEIEWEGNMMNDGIADAVLAVLLTVESSPAAVKCESALLLLSTLPPSTCRIADGVIDSSAKHALTHNHNHTSAKPNLPTRNLHANLTPEERFERLCWFLESQFGPNITPLAHPKLSAPNSSLTVPVNGNSSEKPQSPAPPPDSDTKPSVGPDGAESSKNEEQREEEELKRLHALGIPVPGVEIKVDKHVARVWLETLEVECGNAVLRDRVKAVVERAVETVAPLAG